MRVVDSDIVGSGESGATPRARSDCAFTTVSLIDDATLVVCFRRGEGRDYADGLMSTYVSQDLGRTWEAREVDAAGNHLGEPGELRGRSIARLSDGEIVETGLSIDSPQLGQPFVHPETTGLLPMHIVHRRSVDGGRSWGEWKRMDTAPHTAASPCSMAVLELADGVLAQPYECWKEYEEPAPAPQAAYLRLSFDRGDTWPEWQLVAAAEGTYYWDQRIAIAPDEGRLAAMFWTHDSRSHSHRDSHLSWGSPDGTEWREPVGTGLPGQHTQPLALGGERLLAIYPRRDEEPGIVLSHSRDSGATWLRGEDLWLYRHGGSAEAGSLASETLHATWRDMSGWTFGHPRCVLIEPGVVFAVYRAGGTVHWTLVEV